MSSSSLPSYAAPSFSQIPSYSAEPHQTERRIALVDRLRPRPTGIFVKKSKNGEAQLRLSAQENNTALPLYGVQSRIEGIVELSKSENVMSVEVKIVARLLLREIAEGGTTSAKFCLATDILWEKDTVRPVCPNRISFSLYLPSSLTHEGKPYPLPPTFDVKLSGLPGFTASVDYSVVATISKQQGFPAPLRTTVLGGPVTVAAPFNYYPRSRPATSLPSPLRPSRRGFIEAPNWICHHSEIRSKRNSESIKTKLHLPASRTFCISQPIPFHLTFESESVQSLASFLQYCPTPTFINRKQATCIQLMRQSTVDVRNTTVAGTKTDMWRVDCIGEGSFRQTGEGPTLKMYSGEINISKSVRVVGFKVSGLSVKDCILLSMMPPDQHRSPFAELRQLIPVKLTTDTWVADGTGVGVTQFYNGSEQSFALHPEET